MNEGVVYRERSISIMGSAPSGAFLREERTVRLALGGGLRVTYADGLLCSGSVADCG